MTYQAQKPRYYQDANNDGLPTIEFECALPDETMVTVMLSARRSDRGNDLLYKDTMFVFNVCKIDAIEFTEDRPSDDWVIVVFFFVDDPNSKASVEAMSGYVPRVTCDAICTWKKQWSWIQQDMGDTLIVMQRPGITDEAQGPTGPQPVSISRPPTRPLPDAPVKLDPNTAQWQQYAEANNMSNPFNYRIQPAQPTQPAQQVQPAQARPAAAAPAGKVLPTSKVAQQEQELLIEEFQTKSWGRQNNICAIACHGPSRGGLYFGKIRSDPEFLDLWKNFPNISSPNTSNELYMTEENIQTESPKSLVDTPLYRVWRIVVSRPRGRYPVPIVQIVAEKRYPQVRMGNSPADQKDFVGDYYLFTIQAGTPGMQNAPYDRLCKFAKGRATIVGYQVNNLFRNKIEPASTINAKQRVNTDLDNDSHAYNVYGRGMAGQHNWALNEMQQVQPLTTEAQIDDALLNNPRLLKAGTEGQQKPVQWQVVELSTEAQASTNIYLVVRDS